MAARVRWRGVALISIALLFTFEGAPWITLGDPVMFQDSTLLHVGLALPKLGLTKKSSGRLGSTSSIAGLVSSDIETTDGTEEAGSKSGIKKKGALSKSSFKDLHPEGRSPGIDLSAEEHSSKESMKTRHWISFRWSIRRKWGEPKGQKTRKSYYPSDTKDNEILLGKDMGWSQDVGWTEKAKGTPVHNPNDAANVDENNSEAPTGSDGAPSNDQEAKNTGLGKKHEQFPLPQIGMVSQMMSQGSFYNVLDPTSELQTESKTSAASVPKAGPRRGILQDTPAGAGSDAPSDSQAESEIKPVSALELGSREKVTGDTPGGRSSDIPPEQKPQKSSRKARFSWPRFGGKKQKGEKMPADASSAVSSDQETEASVSSKRKRLAGTLMRNKRITKRRLFGRGRDTDGTASDTSEESQDEAVSAKNKRRKKDGFRLLFKHRKSKEKRGGIEESVEQTGGEDGMEGGRKAGSSGKKRKGLLQRLRLGKKSRSLGGGKNRGKQGPALLLRQPKMLAGASQNPNDGFPVIILPEGKELKAPEQLPAGCMPVQVTNGYNEFSSMFPETGAGCLVRTEMEAHANAGTLV